MGIEIKRNQRDTIDLIKKCIEESIRKALPLKHILEIYLGDEYVEKTPDDNFEKTITEVDEINLKKLLEKDLSDNKQKVKTSEGPNSNFIEQENKDTQSKNTEQFPEVKGSSSDGNSNSTKKTNTITLSLNKTNSSTKKESQGESQKGGNVDGSNSSKDINSKILNILNNKDLDLSDDNATSEKKHKNKKLSETSSEDLISNNMDSNLKKILKNDLGAT